MVSDGQSLLIGNEAEVYPDQKAVARVDGLGWLAVHDGHGLSIFVPDLIHDG